MSDDVGLDCHVQNNHGETALHCAAQYGHTRVVAALLSSGADAAVENTKFQTPLELAALYGRSHPVSIFSCRCYCIRTITLPNGQRHRVFIAPTYPELHGFFFNPITNGFLIFFFLPNGAGLKR